MATDPRKALTLWLIAALGWILGGGGVYLLATTGQILVPTILGLIAVVLGVAGLLLERSLR